jgi:hypothetical protein
VKQPFLLWLAYTAPPQPWYTDEKYKKPYQGRGAQLAPPAHPPGGRPFDWETYYSVITHLDERSGGSLPRSKRLACGTTPCSCSWATTDSCAAPRVSRQSGSLGGIGSRSSDCVRRPVRARGPAEAPVASVDVPATFLDYAGLKPAYALAGQSLRPELETGKSRREEAF